MIKDVLKHAGYAVTKDGRIWSKKTSKFLSQHLTHNGYLTVSLYDKRQYCYRVHRLVLEAFVGLCPDDMECRHFDGNRTNNKLNNLSWGTKQDNFADMKRHGRTTGASGEQQGTAKLRTMEIFEIRKCYKSGKYTQRKLAKTFRVSQQNIYAIVQRKTWKHI